MKIHNRTINSETIQTMSEGLPPAEMLEVEAGANGFRGGDGGHGARTYLRFHWDDVLCIETRRQRNGFIITTSGDWETEQMIKALKFAASVLEANTDEAQRE